MNSNKAIENLLINCAGLAKGDSFLIVQENAELGWYDSHVAEVVRARSVNLGLRPAVLQVQGPETELTAAQLSVIDSHDKVVYFARIGDQDRFAVSATGRANIMCYARDVDMLMSAYGFADYQTLVSFKDAINEILFSARRIEISCPLGTKISGHVDNEDDTAADVSIRRFPLGVFKPVPAEHFSGRVALNRYLTSSGSRAYQPAAIDIQQPVFVDVESGRITGFVGRDDIVSNIRCHYKMVSEMFDIDQDAVHSWHAGIHPGCSYSGKASQNPDRWSNTVFNNPRFLHFHTCGNYPPGEICWMILDHSVIVDDIHLWDKGRLLWHNFSSTRECVQKSPELKSLFQSPSDMIGIAA